MSKDETGAALGLSAFYGNAYLLHSAQSLWQASVATKRAYPLPEHELTATLYAAFAAEAYLNTALDLMLGREDAKGLQRVPLADRWLLGPRLVLGVPVIQAGEEPHATLVELIRERNRLAHAKSIYTGWRAGGKEERTHSEPKVIARYILRVSQAVDQLGRGAPELESLLIVPSQLLHLEAQLARFDPAQHADPLRSVLRRLRVKLAEEEFGTLAELVEWGEDVDGAYWTDEDTIEEILPDP